MGEIFFKIIASSSSGNCAYLRARQSNVLIDAGISPRRIKNARKELGQTLENIDAIFLTHEHGDHCKALETLPENENMAVFASEQTYETIVCRHPETQKFKWKVFTPGQSFSFKDLKVCTCALPHDSSECVAYKFLAREKSISWITDLGKPVLGAKDFAKNSNVLVLESNYCPKMLQNSNRTLRVKRRIAGTHGHLSNADAISVLQELDPDFVEQIYLAHVSRECNSVEHISDLLKVLPEKILQKIEIVSPFDGSKNPFSF
ncbi:MAG: MBL fold metallo-hydrolase [Opitutales bacterium]|nr:MBL fold metallo-hydrolase [Opitutales bacterium]